MVVGPREGRSSSKEQYVYIYRYNTTIARDDKFIMCDTFLRIETVQVLYSYTYDDYDDVFERSPLVAHIRDLTPSRMLQYCM